MEQSPAIPAHRQRMPYIDNVKGFGMLLVVLGHVIHAFSTKEMYANNLFMGFVALFYMKMFFFFSGYVYVFSDTSIMVFIRKTFTSLAWPCMVVYGGGKLLTFCITTFLKSQDDTTEFFTIDELINFYWFCKSLFVCRIALFCFCKLNKKEKKWWSNEIVLSILFIAGLYAMSVELWHIKLMMVFYVLGYISNKYSVFSLLNKKRVTLLAVAGIVGLCIVKYAATVALAVKLASMFLPLPIIVFVYYTFKKYLNRKVWMLTAIGKHSLLIYLLHILILKVTNTVLENIMDISTLFNILFWIPFFVLLTAASLLTSNIVTNNAYFRKIVLLK